jgi:hypothetical protein
MILLILPDVVGSRRPGVWMVLMYNISVNYFRLSNFYLSVVYLLHSHTPYTHSYTYTTFP